LACGQGVLQAAPIELDDEAATQLDPGPAGRLQGFCNLIATTSRNHPAHVEPREHMPAVIRCECGWQCRAESREKAVAAMRRHLADAHRDLPTPPMLADLLAMAEEQ
jgi:hypothetical protein